METDRWNYLAIRAYSSGLLTFRRSDRQDIRWQLKEAILLGEVERGINAKLHEIRHLAESNAAQYVDQPIFDYHFGRAQAEYECIAALLYPFVAKGLDKGKVKSLIEAWESTYGNLESEETQEMIRKAVDAIKKVKRSNNVEDTVNAEPERPRDRLSW